uniref:Uncharacterized protein n=1 Tax=Candidatus Kentrum sp. UNK TaxID=2126344 RepID=A0A451AQP9_9GAMM|nr:MAG: hypothetical protein BECKUNK1418G_GA0071005_12261 [Candidatus Kentron sp. UNK]
MIDNQILWQEILELYTQSVISIRNSPINQSSEDMVISLKAQIAKLKQPITTNPEDIKQMIRLKS